MKKTLLQKIVLLMAFTLPCVCANAQQMVSAKTAIDVYTANTFENAQSVLQAQGYTYHGKNTQGYHYWCKNCSVTPAFKPTAFTRGTSSVVSFKIGEELKIQVFNQKAVDDYYDQLERMGLSWMGAGTGVEMVIYEYNPGYPKLSLVIGQGYAYEELKGYFLSIYGEIAPNE